MYIHMKRIKSGNLSPITTRYEVDVGDIVEVMDDDEVSSVITKVNELKALISHYKAEVKKLEEEKRK